MTKKTQKTPKKDPLDSCPYYPIVDYYHSVDDGHMTEDPVRPGHWTCDECGFKLHVLSEEIRAETEEVK